jgi:hypothetical protein
LIDGRGRKRTELNRLSILPMPDASITVSGALQEKSQGRGEYEDAKKGGLKTHRKTESSNAACTPRAPCGIATPVA